MNIEIAWPVESLEDIRDVVEVAQGLVRGNQVDLYITKKACNCESKAWREECVSTLEQGVYKNG